MLHIQALHPVGLAIWVASNVLQIDLLHLRWDLSQPSHLLLSCPTSSHSFIIEFCLSFLLKQRRGRWLPALVRILVLLNFVIALIADIVDGIREFPRD